jgi:hypothetical protein
VPDTDPATHGGERWWALTLLALGALERLALWWWNPPGNSFDNHFEPVFLIARDWAIPAKLACFQCYHPPVLYVVSALVVSLLSVLGFAAATVTKSLQFLNCALAIGTTVVVYAVLQRLRMSSVSRLVALALVVFLPRHLYMGAMYANDAAACFFAALSAYLVIRMVQGADGWRTAVLLAMTATAAVFTKYTAFAVLPMIAVAVAMAGWRDPRRVARRAVALLVPLGILGVTMASHTLTYGMALPHNTPLYNPVTWQPADPGGVTFTSFTPWRFIVHPMLRPGQLGSFWTVLFAGLWFDTEPRVALIVGDSRAWREYYAWLSGEGGAYRVPPAPATLLELGGALQVVGLFWLVLGLTGAVEFVLRMRAKAPGVRELVPLAVLLVFTVAGVAYFVARVPVFTAMKASYLLGALPAFAALAGLGAERWMRWPASRSLVLLVAIGYGTLVTVHVVYLLWSARP